jgi:hypothetical protein
MGIAVWIFELAGVGLFVGVPVSIAGMVLDRGWQRWFGVLGALLNLAIFPVGVMAMDLAVRAFGLTIST